MRPFQRGGALPGGGGLGIGAAIDGYDGVGMQPGGVQPGLQRRLRRVVRRQQRIVQQRDVVPGGHRHAADAGIADGAGDFDAGDAVQRRRHCRQIFGQRMFGVVGQQRGDALGEAAGRHHAEGGVDRRRLLRRGDDVLVVGQDDDRPPAAAPGGVQ